MFVAATSAFFKFKAVRSVIILACWSFSERVKIHNAMSSEGLRSVVTCDPDYLLKCPDDNAWRHGILYLPDFINTQFQMQSHHFKPNYSWLVVANGIPNIFDDIRYDADVTLLSLTGNYVSSSYANSTLDPSKQFHFSDVYVHPSAAAASFPWASWSRPSGFQLQHERSRILRRLDLQKYPMAIATPLSDFNETSYKGSFSTYLHDIYYRDAYSMMRCCYVTITALLELLNGTGVLLPTQQWLSLQDNTSMYMTVRGGGAALAGAPLRMLHARTADLEYVTHVWPFSVGFTYLAERDSSSNMFVAPFGGGVWCCCAGTAAVLALVMRATARRAVERDNAIVSVLATFLQQDAEGVPEGISGRWTFIVLSLWAMILHAYYTSAVVSALMSAGVSGPRTLAELADSKYTIASEDIGYVRYLMFDRPSGWDDMEYLKRKKMTSKLYQDVPTGMAMVRAGSTAYHTEFNNFYGYLNTFPDDLICKLSYVPTIEESRTYIVIGKYSEFKNVMRSSASWLHETGLAARVLSVSLNRVAPCRSSMLAEQVKFGDVASVIGVFGVGIIVSLLLFTLELIVDNWKNNRSPNVRVRFN